MADQAVRRAVAALLVVVAGATSSAACGVDAVDTGDEARVLAATCRSWLVRTADVDDADIDVDELEDYLRTEPGGDERSVAGTTREACMRALRAARSDDGS